MIGDWREQARPCIWLSLFTSLYQPLHLPQAFPTIPPQITPINTPRLPIIAHYHSLTGYLLHLLANPIPCYGWPIDHRLVSLPDRSVTIFWDRMSG